MADGAPPLTGEVTPPPNGEVKPSEGEVKPADGVVTPEAKAAADKVAADAAAAKEIADKALAQKDMTPDQKVADDKARAEKKAADEKAKNAKTEGAPEAYAEFKVLEGMVLDKELVAEFTPFAKELNLSQEKAQKLVDFSNKLQQKTADAQAKAWNDALKTWAETGEKDKEIGGADYKANVGLANLVIATFGKSGEAGKESIKPLVDALGATGAANHPEVLRMLVRIGKAIGEGKLRTGGNAGDPPRKTTEQILYGTVDTPTAPTN